MESQLRKRVKETEETVFPTQENKGESKSESKSERESESPDLNDIG